MGGGEMNILTHHVQTTEKVGMEYFRKQDPVEFFFLSKHEKMISIRVKT